MNSFLILMLSLGISHALYAQRLSSTFVGNGGDVGEIELRVVLAEIHDTFDELDQNSDNLCKCDSQWGENELCAMVRRMKKDQYRFCRQILLNVGAEMRTLTAQDSKIAFYWSDDAMKVASNHHRPRAVDAVAQSQNLAIILDRQRFLQMSESFRIALLTHELLHLIKIQGKLVTDEEKVPPFQDGKTLLNTLGAAIAVKANQDDIVSEYESLRNVSKAYKPYIFQINIEDITHSKSVYKKLLKSERSTGSTFLFEYKPQKFGIRGGFGGYRNVGDSFDDFDVQESANWIQVGVGYHWTPIKSSLSRWTETQLIAYFDILYGRSNYEVSDSLLTITDQSNLSGAAASAQINLPLVSDFWLNGGYQLRYVKYQYDQLNLKINDLQQSLYFGGSYAF